MARCEDWPCCNHEAGCCPDYDESGRQLNMVCVCGAKLPVTNRYSICDTCLSRPSEDDPYDGPDEPDEPDEYPEEEEEGDPDELADAEDRWYDWCHPRDEYDGDY